MAPPKQWFDYMSYCANSGTTLFEPPQTASTLDLGPQLEPDPRATSSSMRRERQRSAPAIDPAQAYPAPVAPRCIVNVSGPPSAHLPRSSGSARSTRRPSRSRRRLPARRLRRSGPAGGKRRDGGQSSFHVDGDGHRPPARRSDPVGRRRVGRDRARRRDPRQPGRAARTHPTVNVRQAEASAAGARRCGGTRRIATATVCSRGRLLVNGGRSFEPIFAGPNSGTAGGARPSYLHRSRRARLRVTVNDGFLEALGHVEAVPLARRAAGRADPRAPRSGTIQPNDAPLALTGQAFDDRLERARGQAPHWFSGKRKLGSGEADRPAGLPPGRPPRPPRRARSVRPRRARLDQGQAYCRAADLHHPEDAQVLEAPPQEAAHAGCVVARLAACRDRQAAAAAAVRRRAQGAQGRLRVPRGRKALRLKLTLKTGKRSSVRQSRCGAAEPTVSSPACGAASCSYSGASSRSRRSCASRPSTSRASGTTRR